MSQQVVLVVEDDSGLREAVVDTIALSSYRCLTADCAEQALVILNQQPIDLVVTDVQMGSMDGLALLKNIRARWHAMPVLVMTAFASIDNAVEAIKGGASNYIAKPFAPQVLLNMIEQYMPLPVIDKEQPIVQDESSLKLLSLADKVARTDASVMILGPSGSGKEVLSRYIHQRSRRQQGPFVAINCAAIPENMLEATLFGYDKGAFTGAISACPGKFEQAQGGTILLDEITEMDLALQAKILRVIQEREVERLGSRKVIKLDVRVVATSNRDLKEAVQQGVFREDLYYRLNVFPLKWLPLAKRPGDILVLAQSFVERYHGRGCRINDCAQHKLLGYHWPGNVRELDNVIQRALIVKTAEHISDDDILLEDHIYLAEPSSSPVTAVTKADENLGSELKHQEFQIILDVMQSCEGSRKDMAERLGISARTLRYKLAKMRESGIELPA
ncbi:sigma-54-dependent transcriptional regulator [Thalassotalea maritima]|uniref:sigma-54-dependent transcriptional regulator n=1 Tax=Thalassotalea maritima TaxID=3242416 RepID=UPI0035276641